MRYFGLVPVSPKDGLVTGRARELRRQMSVAERRLWGALRAHRLMGLGFRRQMPVDRYIADFACPAHRLIIEVDGPSHAEHAQRRHDDCRTARLTALGWQVIRFGNDDVLFHLDAVCAAILHAIGPATSDDPPF